MNHLNTDQKAGGLNIFGITNEIKKRGYPPKVASHAKTLSINPYYHPSN